MLVCAGNVSYRGSRNVKVHALQVLQQHVRGAGHADPLEFERLHRRLEELHRPVAQHHRQHTAPVPCQACTHPLVNQPQSGGMATHLDRCVGYVHPSIKTDEV